MLKTIQNLRRLTKIANQFTYSVGSTSSAYGVRYGILNISARSIANPVTVSRPGNYGISYNTSAINTNVKLMAYNGGYQTETVTQSGQWSPDAPY